MLCVHGKPRSVRAAPGGGLCASDALLFLHLFKNENEIGVFSFLNLFVSLFCFFVYCLWVFANLFVWLNEHLAL